MKVCAAVAEGIFCEAQVIQSHHPRYSKSTVNYNYVLFVLNLFQRSTVQKAIANY